MNILFVVLTGNGPISHEIYFICVALCTKSDYICIQWKPSTVVCSDQVSDLMALEIRQANVFQHYVPILFWQGCKYQPVCLEINPGHNSKCVMNPHFLYFGRTKFTSDIRTLPGNPYGGLYNLFPWSELKHLLLCLFHVIMAFGRCMSIRTVTCYHTCLIEKLMIMPHPACLSTFLWLWDALSLVWNERPFFIMLCLLEEFPLAVYSHFPMWCGKCTDLNAAELFQRCFVAFS